MDWKTKTGIAGAILLVIAVLIFIVKVQYDTIERLKAIETSVVESKDIGDGIVRAQSSYVTKADLERLLKEQGMNIDAIRKDLRKLGADVQGVNYVNITTPGYSGTDKSSSYTKPKPKPDPTNPTNPTDPKQPLTDPNGYFTNQQWFTLTEPFNGGTMVPFGQVGFSAWKDKPWSIEVFPRAYSSTTVLGEDESGRHYAYSKFEIETDGKKYTIPITNARIVEEYPTAKFSFNPRIYLGIDGGMITNSPAHAELTPNVGLSFFSYGQTKVSPQWSFLTLGLGYATQQQAPVLILSPINYNVGKNLPLVDNLHVGPSVSIDADRNLGLYLGVRVAL